MANVDKALNNKGKFADLLFNGKYFPKNLYKEIVDPTISSPSIVSDIRVAPNHLKRVQIVDGLLYTFNLPPKFKPFNGAFRKDESRAGILCERADDKSLDISVRLRYYNLALATTPTKGKQIGEIYGRRAALFLKSKDHEGYWKDLEMALKHGVVPKIKEATTEYNKKLDKLCSRTQNTRPRAQINKDKIERKFYRDEVLFSVGGPPNPKIPVAAECVKVNYDKTKGRYLITTTDLDPGTTIIVENPYIHLLKDCLRWDTQHCGSCAKRSSSLIPCDCMFVMYCDEECRQKGLKSGHLYECPCLPELHGLRTKSRLHTAFRAICKAGPTELHALYIASKQNEEKLPFCSEDKKGFNVETGIYEEDSYYPISNLMSYQDNDKLPAITVMSVVLAHILNFKTSFYSAEPEEPKRNEFIQFVASRILLHATSFPINNFLLFEKSNPPIVSPKTDKITKDNDTSNYKEILTVIYPFISLICHSCFPNSTYKSLTNGRMAITTNQMLKPGDEITISYSQLYWVQEMGCRRTKLESSHHFVCKCIACANQWPRLHTFDMESQFLCPNCSWQLSYKDIATSRKCLLTPFKDGKRICRNCTSQFKSNYMENQMDKHEKEFSKARGLVNAKKPLDAIPIIVECIKFFQRTICPPSNHLLNAMKLLVRAQNLVCKDLE